MGGGTCDKGAGGAASSSEGASLVCVLDDGELEGLIGFEDSPVAMGFCG